MTRKSIPMLTPLSLSVSSKMALLIRRLEILVTLSLALADGACSSGFTASSFKANPDLTLTFRICPGRYMAFSSVWTTVAAILAALEIAKCDETLMPDDGRYYFAGRGVL